MLNYDNAQDIKEGQNYGSMGDKNQRTLQEESRPSKQDTNMEDKEHHIKEILKGL